MAERYKRSWSKNLRKRERRKLNYMNKVEAYLKNVRISPRKVRLVANLLKGMTVSQAESELTFLPKRASSILIKLLRSAKANALQGGFGHESLKVIDVRVDEGRKIKRYRKQAPGRVKKIFKRSSHIHMVLESSGPAVKK